MLSSFSFGPNFSLFATSTIYLSMETKKAKYLKGSVLLSSAQNDNQVEKTDVTVQGCPHTPAPTALSRRLQPEKAMSSKQICLFQTSGD